MLLWYNYDFELNNDGVFEATKGAINNAVSKHIYYTSNKNQNSALKLVKELEFLFSNVEITGHLKKYNRDLIENVTGLLEYSFNDKKELSIQPDYYYIKNLK